MVTELQKVTGYGVTSTNFGTYNVHGHSFNPPLNGGSNNYVVGSNYGTISINTNTTSFDLTDFQPGHEVVMALFEIQGTYGGGVMEIIFQTPGGSQIFFFSASVPSLGASEKYMIWAYMGVKPAYDGGVGEILSNDTYNVRFTGNGGIGVTDVNITITDLDESLLTDLGSGARGSIWVEGNNICFVSYMKTKHTILQSGSVGTPGASNAGSVWIPSSGDYLEYVDSGGTQRRTNQGDTVGWDGNDGMPSTPGGDGSIWVESGFNEHAIMFINNAGEKVRLGNGYLFADEY